MRGSRGKNTGILTSQTKKKPLLQGSLNPTATVSYFAKYSGLAEKLVEETAEGFLIYRSAVNQIAILEDEHSWK